MNTLEKIENRLEALKGELVTLRERVGALQSEHDELEVTARVLRRYADGAELNGTSGTVKVVHSNPFDALTVAHRNPVTNRRPLGDMAAEILRERGTPMRTSDITEIMLHRGCGEIDRRKLRNSLFSSMHRKPEVFTKVGTGTWTLTVHERLPLSE